MINLPAKDFQKKILWKCLTKSKYSLSEWKDGQFFKEIEDIKKNQKENLETEE